MARNIAGRFASMVRRHTQSIYTYAPSFHTLNVHIPMGRLTAASLDGRHAGEPLAKNVGVGINRSRQGPTALICSAAAISQREFFGGQALDLSVDAALFACGDTRKKVRALIQAYFQSGGLQIQLNGVTAEVLEDARHNPDEHGDLLVRIGGFSMPFVRLSSDTQEEMIRRFRDGV